MSTPTPHTTPGGVEYGVTLVDLQAASSDTHLTAHDVSVWLQQLRTYVTALQNEWQGMAANEFQDLMVLWDRYAAQLNEALRAIGDGLMGNYHNYDNTEVANHRNMASVKANLPAANLA
ncbi:WXG100 family type VII secretion target [Streptomyces sp. HNM0663]|uniref:WXG100 family type VII secretion target n=1 Tax=Streptomyces chengmaiensis TaxID=3040919 RepID=A0ABT6HZ90_9ACTN|nr:WXG100 family type VII secretion target [Streptomyces chengmaiensis]MDH2393573.1 WXG100 family type VII secretion target [Streptomyces chengmaiensis]